MALVTFRWRDRDGEKTTTTIRVDDVASDGSNFATLTTAINALRSEFNNITIGLMESVTISQEIFSQSGSVTNTEAERERKTLIVYEDTSPFLDPPTNSVPNPALGRLYNVEIGTRRAEDPLSNELFPLNSEEADLSQPPWQDLVADFAQVVRSPNGGNVSVRRALKVNRNT